MRNWKIDFSFLLDSSEAWYSKSCTPFEEALVEQCIRLGMPQKNKKPENILGTNESKFCCFTHFVFVCLFVVS